MTSFTSLNRSIFSVLLAGVFCWPAGIMAQGKPTASGNERQQQFARGVAAYNNADYTAANATFKQLLALGPAQPVYTAALYMSARSEYRLGANDEARRLLEKLLREFQGSRYTEHAHMLLGRMRFEDGNYVEAANEFVWVMDKGRDQQLVTQATKLSEALFDDYLSVDDRRRLRRDAIGENGLALVVYKIARHELQQGNRSEGKKVIDDYLDKHPNTIFRQKLENWDKIKSPSGEEVIRIGVILPLTGVDGQEGRALQRGIQYAQLRYNKRPADQTASSSSNGFGNQKADLQFIFRDSESSMVGAMKAMQTLLRDPSIKAVIGELDGAASTALAALAQQRNIPILIPVATQNGMTSLGEYVFQLNSDREQKARALAEYAFEYLGCRTFVTIAPQDVYGQQMTDGLTAAVDQLGGENLAQKWYFEGAEDLGRHFKAIRQAGLRRAFEDSVKLAENPKSTDAVVWPTLGYGTEVVDDLAIPVTSIHAMFLPLYEEDIRLIAAQRAYYNLRTITLGGDYWQNLEQSVRRELQPYIDGTVVCSDYFVDWESEKGRLFRDAFRLQLNVTPDRYEVLGYDAASLFIYCISQGASTPEEIRAALARVDGFAGMKGEISFRDSERVNNRVNILRFSGSNLTRVK